MSVSTLLQAKTSLQRAKSNALEAVAECARATAGALDEIAEAAFQVVTPVTIPNTQSAEAWVYDNLETTNYKWHYDITAESVTSLDVAIVTIGRGSLAVARSCGLCPQNETLSGKIRLRAKSVPESAITAEYYICTGRTAESESQEEQEE